MVMLSLRKSMWMRLPASPSVPSMPSAPPSASGTIGRCFGSTSKSPNSSVSTGTNGTWAEPVAPRSMTVWDGSNTMPSFSTTRAVSAEWLAPVSSTRRNGPWPFTVTGAQMRPILSRRVGATKRGSSAVTATSSITWVPVDVARSGVTIGDGSSAWVSSSRNGSVRTPTYSPTAGRASGSFGARHFRGSQWLGSLT